MTPEEYTAKAMLLGMRYIKGSTLCADGEFHVLFRKRVGEGQFVGTALFSYFDADTLDPIPELQERSEVDVVRTVTTSLIPPTALRGKK